MSNVVESYNRQAAELAELYKTGSADDGGEDVDAADADSHPRPPGKFTAAGHLLRRRVGS
jgi:hypothetical protein